MSRNDKDDSAWVFDSLIGFLQGPIWSSPLMTFIEEKSLVFEANTEDCEEYRKIYQEYKNLVDLLLGCFMEDMGITPEQFEHACTVNRDTKIPIHFQQNLFEQIWAANEYEIFKRMMIQKNLELQLQALNMIEQKYGLTPASLVYETDGFPDDELVMEDLIHKQALENQSEEEPDIPSEPTTLIAEHERLAAEYHNERALLEEALRKSDGSRNTSDDESTEEVECAKVSAEKEQLDKLKLRKTEPLKPIPTSKKKSDEDEMNAEDIKKRQEYLKARRDKLVALKKEARNQQLEMNKTRPSSARIVAEATMKGQQELEAAQAIDPSILQVRKALAARLKAEVVHKVNRNSK
ncbi:cilia- and flagella-associated protein 36-like isoform X2 [Solenopsis invicta]|uniref:cilia- and flagella-associated protein 36 isoform X2 n=1 Tax=Solenopsis invicta TaxID=13686 RepID=UPI0005960F87|nr:cilia- and flagella-associated protein 36 isoform X2 [Solenopsis invicta]XP_039315215.1 cilia- and flagella-associated protein 36 isoform X2 [Solenopsis invicta]XP_039315466.1 cilia- and flagella-associated protein 36-like isoform X2 [Solenopsis invicta]XP_039315467.1 cilia- and flagella-associated protein 36-like isoform X2 [Solenopsis invicta]